MSLLTGIFMIFSYKLEKNNYIYIKSLHGILKSGKVVNLWSKNKKS